MTINFKQTCGYQTEVNKNNKRRWAWGSEEEFKTFNNMDWENGKALPSYPSPPPPFLLWCIITDIPSHTLQSLSEKLLKIPLHVFEIILSKINQNNSSTPLCSTFFCFLENFLSKIFWWALLQFHCSLCLKFAVCQSAKSPHSEFKTQLKTFLSVGSLYRQAFSQI